MPDTNNDLPQRLLIAAAALLGLLAVVGGTFAAHVLPKYIDEQAMHTFEVAVRYHMYHALATLAAVWVYQRWPGRLPIAAGWLFVIGVLLFSGSLYLLVSTDMKWLGMITPLGGTSFIVGWLLLALAVLIPTPPRDA